MENSPEVRNLNWFVRLYYFNSDLEKKHFKLSIFFDFFDKYMIAIQKKKEKEDESKMKLETPDSEKEEAEGLLFKRNDKDEPLVTWKEWKNLKK